jgi:hypothetical protein
MKTIFFILLAFISLSVFSQDVIEYKTNPNITVQCQGMDDIDNRIQYTVKGTFTDADTLAALFPNLSFTVKDGKLQSTSIVWAPILPTIFDQYTVQLLSVGRKISLETKDMGTKILYQTNILNLNINDWEL